MSLDRGRPYLAIPGPSVMPDRVLAAMHRPAPNIYAGALPEMVETLRPDLCEVAGTAGKVAIYIGNGHAGWEAAICNLFSRGDKALVLASGQFGLSWANAARGLGALQSRAMPVADWAVSASSTAPAASTSWMSTSARRRT